MAGRRFAMIPVRIGLVTTLVVSLAPAQQSGSKTAPAIFVDKAARDGIKFFHQAPHGSHKYLLETMGSGVALFDADNDGRLDILLVNGAPFSDPTAKDTIPQKTGPTYWNS